MPAATIAEAAAAGIGTLGGAGTWCAMYNRENYQYDSEMRFQRFTAARGYANTQTTQYREDCRGMTEMTSGKMDTVYVVCTLFMCIAAAASCAGRIGMHGAAPPSYLCALFSGHIFLSILLLTLSMWLALHASLRAQCGNISLLTRKVRLPIPSVSQLDAARNFASGFERQKWHDLFRVPFMSHADNAPELPDESSGDSGEDEFDKATRALRSSKASTKKSKNKEKAETREGFKSSQRASVPSWIRDEQVVDKGGGIVTDGPTMTKAPHDCPEHFKLYANAQNDWWPYDVYARICMLYGVLQFLFAITYYAIGTTMSELRAFWIMWSLPLMFLCAQVLILRMDILRGNGLQMLPNMEWAGHVAPYLCICAITLDYRAVYTPLGVLFTWAFVFATFLGHLLFCLRLLDLAWPYHYRETDMEDEPGKAWVPASWKLPPAFTKALWVIAPPKHLEKGQHCLLNEMHVLARSSAGVASCRKRKKAGDKPYSVTHGPHATVAEVKHMVKSTDNLIRWWMEESVFSKVPEADQRKLQELKQKHQACRKQASQLKGGSKDAGAKDSGDEGQEQDSEQARRIVLICDKVQEIEDGIAEIEARNKDAVAADGTVHGGVGAYSGSSPFNVFNTGRSTDLPWQLTRVAIVTNIGCWVFMLIATGVELAMGQDSLLKPPGEAPWIRDMRAREWTAQDIHYSNQASPQKYRLWAPVSANYQFKDAVEHMWVHQPINSQLPNPALSSHQATHGHPGRRLSDENRSTERISAAIDDLMKTLPTLGWLQDAVEHRDEYAAAEKAAMYGVPMTMQTPRPPMATVASSSTAKFMAPALKVVPTSWPAFFEPRHMACGTDSAGEHVVLALTSRGSGAALKLDIGSDVSDVKVKQVTSFSLHGVNEFGPLAGAALTASGLRVMTKLGRVLLCEGVAPAGAAWHCREAADAMPLPVEQGSRLLASAVSEDGLIALLSEDMPHIVSLFRAGEKDWEAAGEVHLPPTMSGDHFGASSLAFKGSELLVVSGSTGEVYRRSTASASVVARTHAAPHSSAEGKRHWRSACALPAAASSEGLLRLSLHKGAGSQGIELVVAP
eukprot:TRINITY_DN13519_c0_g1_i1.p1 TRINITY_DN13519_c0_g1~~TRINITY_DN13519_c0_g1_i1.p1  ORF type:complete len:1075 (+),score=263.15 TRINITY_DN13519_c0_g1_i1:145-3369(+)